MIQQPEVNLKTGTVALLLGSHRPAVSVCWTGVPAHVRPCGPALTQRDRSFSSANGLLLELERPCC